MSALAPTAEQAAAIGSVGRDVLLEAGAGTGKTGVMVERYCRLVCDLGVHPDAVLAFTFTDKAAAELRERIRVALARRAAAGEARAEEVLREVGSAWVTTIHGFCNRVLAGHPVAAGIDPRFRVLDEIEATRAAGEAFEDALEELLAGGDADRERTVAAYDVAGLRSLVLAAHAELRSRGVAEPALPEPPEPDPGPALREAAEAAAAALEEMKPTARHRETVERAAALLGAGVLPELDEMATLRVESKAKALVAYCEAIDAALARVAEMGEGGASYEHLRLLLELFTARYAAAKERRAAIDFEDLQILATRLLERGELGESYRNRFAHLLVDEFQDTNRLQLRLIEALRGPRTELMVVGDELQSIYGFRHADLDVFRERRRAAEEDAGAAAMALSGNFRSRPEVLAAVNALGDALLGGSYRPLRVGGAGEELPAPAPGPDARPPVELLLTGRDGWDEEEIELEPATDATTPPALLAEARFLAERLRALADAGVERGEMVVLLRAYTHLDAYEDSLERAGLRPYVVGGRGYWSQQQVADVRALLAAIANPLDDQALLGALASPACGVAPDTLWLLRAAAGRNRHLWPALGLLAGTDPGAEPEDPERLEAIPASERELLGRFVAVLTDLRGRAPRLGLDALTWAAITETGYDLAVLSRPTGEARFANLRKLARLAEEFERREGRDLRALLDFLAGRAEADVEAQAATSVEGHDGVRIMTVHGAKGLEFGTVAVPGLSRRLLAGSRAPMLEIGREAERPRVGMKLRRLGARAIDLYDYRELREEAERRESEEELRLFHVAATRARERLLLSGVVKPSDKGDDGPGRPVVERIAAAFGVDREGDSFVAAAGMTVRVNLPTVERAAELRARRPEPGGASATGIGPAPLVRRDAPAVAARPLSYTALAAFEDCAYRFYLERVLGLPASVRRLSGISRQTTNANGAPGDVAAAQAGGAGAGDGAGSGDRAGAGGGGDAAARGAAVHSLLEWSAAHEWRAPGAAALASHARAAGLDPDDPALETQVLDPVRAWIESPFLAERVRAEGAAARAEVPLLLGLAGTVVRGSIDLLIERDGDPPLVIDYKTDRLGGASPAERAGRYSTQRDIYALAVAEARGAPEVEIAYVFLERPDEPDARILGPDEIAAGRERLEGAIGRIAAAEFDPAPPRRRDWTLCEGCPALGRLCAGPRAKDPADPAGPADTPTAV